MRTVDNEVVDVDELDPDPIAQFRRWYDDVVAADLPEPSAMVVATADLEGRPSARHVLLKQVDERGFVWFTNYESRKGQEIAVNARACLVFPWFPIRRQVIVQGEVERVDPSESDAYFASRDRGSQIGAWASPQSQVIPDRTFLEARVAQYEREFEGSEVERPPHWGGFRLRPSNVELWAGQQNRLHDRFRYERESSGGWTVVRLAP